MLYPTGTMLKRINSLIKHAKNTSELDGMHFRRINGTPRLVQMTDSGHITKHSSYPSEGRMVLYCQDTPHAHQQEPEHVGKDYGGPLCVGGSTCSLFVSSKKA